MLWPHAGLRQPRNVELERQVALARREHPESAPWIRLLEAALGENADGARWDAVVPTPAADRPVKAPLLARADIRIPARLVRGWVRRLLKLVALTNGRRIDAVTLLAAAVRQDDAAIDALATSAGLDPQTLRVAGQMAALPLLHACARALASAVAPSWWEGYCPVCGAWPAVAEYTGLERKRQLRCGRCSTAWAIPTLRCVFCDETRHAELGYLTLEDGDETRKIEICRTCNGYLKGHATVRSLAPSTLLFDDLATVHLDLAALERGYTRPARPGYALDTRIAERRRALLAFGLAPRRADA
jgi:FdhE protein